ncbi:OmpA family protein [Aggregicoccus sp. 17bor-14]|uniref:OmpA family protein n=1 Tax=Myxococcaceae TaxID=31 RepID=UPI00129D0C0F|nr:MULTISPECIES: OmpA family protein [Myxococcaceae]MBF5046326.1 OmpA family protein [Simulacricoccus sp. 17bor-14]MRI92046.1 OmpA family protein [Aggregicoccus sp. 17bor-14]
MLARLGALLLLLVPFAARADAVRVSLEAKRGPGQAPPALLVHILEPIAGFEVKLRRSDGQDVDVKGGGRPGVTRRVDLPQPEGSFHYEGELVVNFPNAETGSMPLSFDTEVLGTLKLSVAPADLDLAARTLRFTLSRPAARAQLTVLMDTGTKAFDGEVRFAGEPAGTPLTVRWPAAQGRVLRISLRVWDTADFFNGLDLFPWQVDIPHEEVHFATGRSDVPAAERPKLDASHARIAEALARYGRFAPLRLYVLGHTDTVGAAADNRALSLARARSIATYFRRKGLGVPLYVEGFGEEAPRVPTPDETDEARNRRAEYIIAVEDPRLPDPPFAPRWRKL